MVIADLQSNGLSRPKLSGTFGEERLHPLALVIRGKQGTERRRLDLDGFRKRT